MMKTKGLRKAAIECSFWEFIAKIVEKAGSFIFIIILARFLLPEGFGAYNLTMSITLIFIAFINHAVDHTLIRYVSHALGKKNKKLASEYSKYIFKKKILFAFSAAALLLILAYPLSYYIFKKPFLFPPLFISGFYIFVLGIESSYESLFYIFKKLKIRTLKEVLKQTLRILVTLLVFFLVAKSYYIEGVIIGLILTNLAILFFVILYVKKFAFFLFKKDGEGKIDKKRVMRFLYYLLVGGATGAVFSYVDVLMLGALLPDMKYIGLYGAAIALIWGFSGLLIFSSVFLPILTQIKKEKLETSFNMILRCSLIITLPATFGIFLLSKYIILMVYGKEYLGAHIILSLMAFLIIETINGDLIGNLFVAKEKPKFVTKITLYVLFLNIVLNLILITSLLNISQLWALIGAAIATIISRYTLLVLLIIFARKKLNVKIKLANWIKPLIASFVMSFVLYCLNNFLIKDITLYIGIIEIILGILIYVLVMFLIKGATKEDLKILKEIF